MFNACIWEQSFAQPEARRHDDVTPTLISHKQTSQTKSTLCLHRLVAMFPKDLFSEYLDPMCEKLALFLYINSILYFQKPCGL